MIGDFAGNLASDITHCYFYNANVANDEEKRKENMRLVSIAIRTCSVAVMALAAISFVATLVTVLPMAPVAACLHLGACAFGAVIAYDAYVIGDNISRVLQPGIVKMVTPFLLSRSSHPYEAWASELLQKTVLLRHLHACCEKALHCSSQEASLGVCQ